MKGIQVYSIVQMKGPARFQGGAYDRKRKYIDEIKKNILQNRWTYVNQIWHKASLGEGDLSLFK